MSQRRRIPPLTPEQSRRARDHLQDLYGGRALPKEPPSNPVEKPEPERRG